jgi:DNA-binding transcriptional regulator/RsmH inhibitor MraZ
MQRLPLVGEYDVTLREDNTFACPAELRRQLKVMGDISLRPVIGANGALWLYPLRLIVSREGKPFAKAHPAPTNSTATDHFDPSGRFRISLIDRFVCDLGHELTLLGVCDHLELWNRVLWQNQRQRLIS